MTLKRVTGLFLLVCVLEVKKMEIISLGCGGGRHQTLDQTFKTGGFRIRTEEVNMHVDPGPGALLLSKKLGLDPEDLDAVFVSHSHLDHSTDAEVLVAAANQDDSGKGRYIGNESAVGGFEDLSPAVSEHHMKKTGEVVSLSPGDTVSFGDVTLEATPTVHTDPTCIGLKVHTDSGTIGYTSDTEYFEELPESFEGSRVLMANVTRPDSYRIDNHLCTDDLVEILKEVEPDLSVILHMGMLFLRNTPTDESDHVEDETGVRTVPGMFGTKLDIDEDEIKVGRKSIQADFGAF